MYYVYNSLAVDRNLPLPRLLPNGLIYAEGSNAKVNCSVDELKVDSITVIQFRFSINGSEYTTDPHLVTPENSIELIPRSPLSTHFAFIIKNISELFDGVSISCHYLYGRPEYVDQDLVLHNSGKVSDTVKLVSKL